ncbi:hypothetical protein NDU88_001308 [Pleurodeles waltl]|uniref:Uncharacterized protein n=1 Tax=Pleurodeles waltl TaxID=8319 RepID=A0AAV7LZA5_PLEWA|nr:hypothetical protein NDU88_001308 [Pleurodeles waltl]
MSATGALQVATRFLACMQNRKKRIVASEEEKIDAKEVVWHIGAELRSNKDGTEVGQQKDSGEQRGIRGGRSGSGNGVPIRRREDPQGCRNHPPGPRRDVANAGMGVLSKPEYLFWQLMTWKRRSNKYSYII